MGFVLVGAGFAPESTRWTRDCSSFGAGSVAVGLAVGESLGLRYQAQQFLACCRPGAASVDLPSGLSSQLETSVKAAGV